jgi:hypothetical protein
MVFKREDLVVLQYASNNCYVSVTEIDGNNQELDSLVLDLEKGLWSYRNYRDKQIGDSRLCSEQRFGVIGVYDRTNITHLNSMVNAVKDALSPRQSPMRH